MYDSSQPHGLQPTRLLRPWDFPGKSTGVGAIAFSSKAQGLVINTQWINWEAWRLSSWSIHSTEAGWYQPSRQHLVVQTVRNLPAMQETWVPPRSQQLTQTQGSNYTHTHTHTHTQADGALGLRDKGHPVLQRTDAGRCERELRTGRSHAGWDHRTLSE